MKGYYADHIVELLRQKHSKDVFVAECKDGPTHYTSHLRMDAWVMNRSWAHPCYTAYEVKVSRSDFLGDKKWRLYLPYCNEFYFVAPKGLIRLDELPPEAGLLELLGGVDGKRLVTRKRAVWRDVTPPEALFRYVLMARVKVGRSEFHIEQTRDERAEQWRRFVDEKVETRKLGYQVSKAIREKVEHVEQEAKDANGRMAEYDEIRDWLRHIGVDPNGRVYRWSVEQKLKEQEALFPQEFIWAMKSLRESLDTALEQLEPKEKVNAA